MLTQSSLLVLPPRMKQSTCCRQMGFLNQFQPILRIQNGGLDRDHPVVRSHLLLDHAPHAVACATAVDLGHVQSTASNYIALQVACGQFPLAGLLHL